MRNVTSSELPDILNQGLENGNKLRIKESRVDFITQDGVHEPYITISYVGSIIITQFSINDEKYIQIKSESDQGNFVGSFPKTEGFKFYNSGSQLRLKGIEDILVISQISQIEY